VDEQGLTNEDRRVAFAACRRAVEDGCGGHHARMDERSVWVPCAVCPWPPEELSIYRMGAMPSSQGNYP